VQGLTPSTPVLFLDFDGVMHPYDRFTIEDNFCIATNVDRFCWLPLLTDALADHPAVRIVVASDWRHFCDDEKLRGFLGPLASRFAGSTGLASGFTRADYIQQVVQLQALQYWCALDDDPSVRNAALEEPQFLACNSATGLSEPTLLAAVGEWLRGLPTEFVSE
jgi:hypothetical protein